MGLLKKLFGGNPEADLPKPGEGLQADFSEPIFFAQQIRQDNFDIEINEGMSSGIRRYATLDASDLSEEEIKQVIGKLVRAVHGFNMCKLVQVAGFTKDVDRRYIVVSGESHEFYQTSAKNMLRDMIAPILEEFPVEYVEAHIEPPVRGRDHQATDFGPYGAPRR
jgi:hypothetical protein